MKLFQSTAPFPAMDGEGTGAAFARNTRRRLCPPRPGPGHSPTATSTVRPSDDVAGTPRSAPPYQPRAFTR